MVPKPGNLLGMHVFFHTTPRPETETVGIGPSKVYFNKPSRGFLSTVKFGNHCSKAFPFSLCLRAFLIHNLFHFVTHPLPLGDSALYHVHGHLCASKGCISTAKSYFFWMTLVFRGQRPKALASEFLDINNHGPHHALANDTSGHILNFAMT